MGQYEFIGFADENKTFTDTAVPTGIQSVGYRVAARLSSGPQSGWSQTLTVPFGSQSFGPVGSIMPEDPADAQQAG